MPVIVQVCIVIITIALAAVAVAFIRSVGQLRSTAAQIERTMGRFEQTMPELDRAISDARGVVSKLDSIAARADRLSEEFAVTGSRLAHASSLVVDEVVDPVTKIAALVRGVRAGATVLVGSVLKRRVAGPASAPQGGNHHE
jgi:uncharacterized protein YoxC